MNGPICPATDPGITWGTASLSSLTPISHEVPWFSLEHPLNLPSAWGQVIATFGWGHYHLLNSVSTSSPSPQLLIRLLSLKEAETHPHSWGLNQGPAGLWCTLGFATGPSRGPWFPTVQLCPETQQFQCRKGGDPWQSQHSRPLKGITVGSWK